MANMFHFYWGGPLLFGPPQCIFFGGVRTPPTPPGIDAPEDRPYKQISIHSKQSQNINYSPFSKFIPGRTASFKATLSKVAAPSKSSLGFSCLVTKKGKYQHLLSVVPPSYAGTTHPSEIIFRVLKKHAF